MLEQLLGISVALAENTAASTAATAATAAEGATQEVMLIRPQRKKDKQVKEMLNNLKAGDRICTIGGIYGTITGLKDDTVTLSVGKDNLSMVVARWGIRSVEEVSIENDAQDLN